MEELRGKLKDKKRIVVKIGSSSLQHAETGDLDYTKMDILVRESSYLCMPQGLYRFVRDVPDEPSFSVQIENLHR